MRDPAPEAKVAGALDQAGRYLRFLKRWGVLEPGAVDEDFIVRSRVHIKLTMESARVMFDEDERAFLLRLLRENKEAAARRRKGRPATKTRDFWIVQMVARLVNGHGLTPTRNRNRNSGNNSEQKRLTACEVVAQVLGELGTNLSVTGVETIWSRRPGNLVDHLPPISPSPKQIARIEALASVEAVRQK
jgi:hypothetical protein